MTNYRNGAAFERKVRDALYEEGAKLVVRSAGSRGPVDLVAFYESAPTKLVQAKMDGVLSGSDRETLASLSHSLGIPTYLAFRSTGGITMKQLSFTET